MKDHRKLISALGFVLVLCAFMVASVVWLNKGRVPRNEISIRIVIDNRTDKPIGPFVVSQRDDSAPLRIEIIAPDSGVDVYYQTPVLWGENAITMRDESENYYSIVGYFEGSQTGRVDIRVECTTPNGLSGKKRDMVDWDTSYEWRPWGESACE
jgi:hypothetical protein